MDRLWDVWTPKQKRLNLPYRPSDQDWELYSKEPFLFFVDGNGKFVGSGKAGDYFDTEKFEYEYEPGFGENIVRPPSPELRAKNTIYSPKTLSRVGLRCSGCDFQIKATAETYSTVGRSLPLALLGVWEKYRPRLGAVLAAGRDFGCVSWAASGFEKED
jgi:hypothetical protein